MDSGTLLKELTSNNATRQRTALQLIDTMLERGDNIDAEVMAQVQALGDVTVSDKMLHPAIVSVCDRDSSAASLAVLAHLMDHSDNLEARQTAFAALLRRMDDNARERAIFTVKHHPDTAERSKAIQQLRDHRGTDVSIALLTVIGRDPLPHIRQLAADALLTVDGEAAIHHLTNAVITEKISYTWMMEQLVQRGIPHNGANIWKRIQENASSALLDKIAEQWRGAANR